MALAAPNHWNWPPEITDAPRELPGMLACPEKKSGRRAPAAPHARLITVNETSMLNETTAMTHGMCP